jgi:hypothetical protein
MRSSPARPSLPTGERCAREAPERFLEAAFALLEPLTSASGKSPEALYLFGELAASSGLHLDRGEACLKRYLDHAPSGEEPSTRVRPSSILGAIHVRRKERGLARDEYNVPPSRRIRPWSRLARRFSSSNKGLRKGTIHRRAPMARANTPLSDESDSAQLPRNLLLRCA